MSLKKDVDNGIIDRLRIGRGRATFEVGFLALLFNCCADTIKKSLQRLLNGGIIFDENGSYRQGSRVSKHTFVLADDYMVGDSWMDALEAVSFVNGNGSQVGAAKRSTRKVAPSGYKSDISLDDIGRFIESALGAHEENGELKKKIAELESRVTELEESVNVGNQQLRQKDKELLALDERRLQESSREVKFDSSGFQAIPTH